MQRRLTAMVLAGFVLVGALGIGATAALGNAQAAGNESAATVSASATGTVSAEPDRAVVFVSATAEAANASAATGQLAENVSQLRGAFGDGNRSVASVETTGFQVFQQEREDGTVVYVARQSFEITTTNTSAAGDVIDAAIANGADEIGGVSFALSDERRQELRGDAIAAAVDDARSQAAAAAGAAGPELGDVQSISVSSDGGGGPVFARAEDAGTTIDASPVTVSASVEVTYETNEG